MTEPPAGLLTEQQREALTDPGTTADTRDEIRERVRDRLAATLHDSDFRAVFADVDGHEQAALRTAMQHSLSLLVIGMLHNDDDLELRLSDAIRNATLDYGEDISVGLTIRRGPLLSIQRSLSRFEAEGLTTANLLLFERLCHRAEADAEQLVQAASALDIDASMEEFTGEREQPIFERPPQTAIVSVDIEPTSEQDRTTNRDTQQDP